jgi:trigger factor
MKVVVNELDACRRGLQVEIPGEQVSEELERAMREYSRRAHLPGFRPGKIPLDLVRQRFGKELRDEVIGRMVQQYALKALEEKKLHPVHDPVLDEVHYEAGRPLVFKATFEVRPIVSVSDYHRIPVSVGRREVTDEMVETSLRGLAERAAKLEAVSGRPVQKGDYAVGTLSCRFLKGKGRDLTDEPFLLEAGAEDNHPDFNAALLGAEAGETRSFETVYPEDDPSQALRGTTVAYTLGVKEIKRKIVPPIDDDLARELGSFQGLNELKESVRREIERRAKAAEDAEAKDRILAVLVERHGFEVPAALVEEQIDARLEGIVRDLMARGVDPTKASVNWREEREKLRPGAIKSVRAMLILDAIAAQEGIETTEDDVNNRLREEARRHGKSLAALKEEFVAKARLAGLRRQIAREKVLDFLLNDATITHEGK